MKIFCIIDGLGDRGCRVLGGKTPLEYAAIPNLNEMAKNGKTGLVYPVEPGYVPQSDEGVLSLLGYNLKKFYTGRGVIEAIGANMQFKQGDLALRANFATLVGGKLVDRRVGRSLSSDEAKKLAQDVNKYVKLDIGFEFRHTVEHRGVLILKRNQGIILSDKISNVDGEYGGSLACRALNKNAYNTAIIVNEFLANSREILKDNKINLKRKKMGLLEANFILLRGAGNNIPILKKKKNWCAVLSMPVEIGIARLCGMQVKQVKVPALKRDIYDSLYKKLNLAIKTAIKSIKSKDYEHYYIHFKEIDIPGHDNRPNDKVKMLELLDKKFFSFIKKIKNVEIIVTGDHSTPCELRKHSEDPVPLLWYGKTADDTQEFNEVACKKGELGELFGDEILSLCGWE
ncbi:MAG TPA: alkaline phosphatase family protein [Candidatus Nanoarchaeia archaeon]|nr:alkaline phosphatase family protein [Candidatus Nanoarchaeia archaeon]